MDFIPYSHVSTNEFEQVNAHWDDFFITFLFLGFYALNSFMSLSDRVLVDVDQHTDTLVILHCMV